MTTDAANVVKFTPRTSPPRLMSCDVHLCADFSIELRLLDAGGNLIERLETGRLSAPEVISWDELQEFWDRTALAQAGITTDSA